MRIAIVGAGAMGGVWAIHLSKSGNNIVVIDVAQTVIQTINTQGLSIVATPQPDASFTEQVQLKATNRPEEVGSVDAVFFFVKAQHTASAATLAQPLVARSTIVVSLQNGWGNADVLAQTFPSEQIVVGVTYHSATVVAPGRVAHTGKGPTFLGPYDDNADLGRAHTISTLLNAAGIENSASEKVKTEIWKKLILNCATLPTAALTGLRAGNLGQPGPMLDLVDALTAEAVTVAQALGYDIQYSERVERIHTILAGAGTGKASMLQDAEARRKTEIEVVNGAVVRAGERLGIDVPLNKTMVALIHGLERGWQQ